MNILEKIKQPEGRRLEFKEFLPTNADLTKTIIAFANDAGGELFIGIKNNPRVITGIQKKDLDRLENQISNLVNDACEPTILPEISFIEEAGKFIIRVYIHKGSKPPYFLKSKGKETGTFLRVGSSNRLANDEIVQQLVRIGNRISFDAELVFNMTVALLNIENFKAFFKDKTDEVLSDEVLKKLDLIKNEQGQIFPTNALVLLSNDDIKKQLFPNAKIECARFKGTVPGNYIDQKSIDGSIADHAELAYQFVKRHISQGVKDYEGVYRIDRWEYPMIAIREVIRNAVIHRDYSLLGKDIKIAIFDDKIEITSPGKLLPTVDFNQMNSGQSDVRNKILAPVFKRMGIIEQWGNGLQLIADDLKDYPEIKLAWQEPGVAFRVTFIKTNYKQRQELQQELRQELQQELQQELRQELRQELQQESLYTTTLRVIAKETAGTSTISKALGQKSISGQLYQVINKLREDRLIAWTIPETPKSSKQQYKITERGIMFLRLLNNKNAS